MDDSTSSASDAHSMMSPLRGTSDVVEKAITNLIERASPKHSPLKSRIMLNESGPPSPGQVQFQSMDCKG